MTTGDQQAVLVACDHALSRDDATLILEAVGLTQVAAGMSPGVRGHRRGCQCRSCRSMRARAKARRRAAVDPSIIPHGSEEGYQYYACRCDPCTDAHADYARDRYEPIGVAS